MNEKVRNATRKMKSVKKKKVIILEMKNISEKKNH